MPAPGWVPSTGEIVRDRLATLESDWHALSRPVPAGMLAAARTAAETLTSAACDRAVDGALHHEQVLGGQREPWLTVDPRLLRGDIGYDLARCLWDRLHEMPDAATINEQLDIIADAAGLDRDHARRSAIFRTIDYWLWGLQHRFTEDPRRCRRWPPHCFSDPAFHLHGSKPGLREITRNLSRNSQPSAGQDRRPRSPRTHMVHPSSAGHDKNHQITAPRERDNRSADL